MGEFTIEIAGLVTRVHALFESTGEYCRRYRSHREPEFSVTITPADLAFEQKMLDEEAVEEGLRLRVFSQPFLERAAIQRQIAEKLLERDTLLFHGSTVGLDGYAYLFTAGCGTGKSTHTRLWREVFGQRAVMVNDDKPFLQITPTGVTAFGSPWSGKHGLDSNVALPLKGICILHRGSENTIRPLARTDAMAMLIHQSYHPLDPGQEPRFLALVEALAKQTPLWNMTCTKDSQAALVSHAAMSAQA